VLRRITADLHLHTCLSPCADLLMSPRAVAERSAQLGLELIAVCDHNSAENAAAAIRAGRRYGVEVIPGMEITSREEAHLLGLFPSVDAALEVQEVIHGALPWENDPDKFGQQIVADDQDNVEAFNPRLLLGATTLSVEEVVGLIRRAEGLAIASHIDRGEYSIISQLGFLPPTLRLDALEVSYVLGLRRGREIYGKYGLPLVCSSDAHAPEEIGRGGLQIECAAAGFKELRLALAGESGRRIVAPE